MSDLNENFNIISNMSLKGSGICYCLNTQKDVMYNLIVCGYIKTGTVAYIISENFDKEYIFTKEVSIHEIGFKGTGSKITFNIIFRDNRIRNVLKIYYVGVLDQNNIPIDIEPFTKLNKPKMCYTGNMNFWDVYLKMKCLNKDKYIIVENENDSQEIFEIFDETFGKILLKEDVLKGYYDDQKNIFILPRDRHKYYLYFIKDKTYHIK